MAFYVLNYYGSFNNGESRDFDCRGCACNYSRDRDDFAVSAQSDLSAETLEDDVVSAIFEAESLSLVFFRFNCILSKSTNRFHHSSSDASFQSYTGKSTDTSPW